MYLLASPGQNKYFANKHLNKACPTVPRSHGATTVPVCTSCCPAVQLCCRCPTAPAAPSPASPAFAAAAPPRPARSGCEWPWACVHMHYGECAYAYVCVSVCKFTCCII